MQQASRIERKGTSADRMLAASAGLRRRLRMFNIVLAVVGVEAIVFVALRAWSAL